MTEKIGNVVLDYSYYSGEDHYSDGAIEDELLKIVQEQPQENYPEMIEKEKSWPVFYHLSQFRTNIIDWLPFKKTDRVLEIGSGCGAITSSVAKKAGHVTCVDLSKKRSLVNAYRNKEQDNITILVGNFKDIEPALAKDYDYVLLIGVFEYGKAYIGGKNPYEDFMAICNQHRAKNGRMIIAIENKFGLKYWAGCREDHLGTLFSGLEGYHEGGAARTFTRKGLEQIMRRVGISQYSFYYPYPDYKFMTAVYSDRYLPKKGELSNNLRNFDRDRMITFDEKQVFDQIIEEGEFSLFSNSYLVVIGKTPELIYSKFSNDRAKPWAIRTSIYENAFGELYVEKIPDTPAARGHIKNTKRAYDLLSKRYEGTKVVMDPCAISGSSLKLAYCQGETLEELLDKCLQNADVTGFKALIQEYMQVLSHGEDQNVSNIDFGFANIIIKGEVWQIIDYEWTFERHVPKEEIAFRAFYNYMLGGADRMACKELLYKDILQLTDEQIETYIEEEREFQNYITGKRAAVADMREIIGNKAYDARTMQNYYVEKDKRYVYQMFFDYGEGFSEENSIHQTEGFATVQRLQFSYDLPEQVKRLRIDPISFSCIVRILELRLDGKTVPKEEIAVNGDWVSEDSILFCNDDPNIVFSCENAKTISVVFDIAEITQEAAIHLHDNVNRPHRRIF